MKNVIKKLVLLTTILGGAVVARRVIKTIKTERTLLYRTKGQLDELSYRFEQLND